MIDSLEYNTERIDLIIPDVYAQDSFKNIIQTTSEPLVSNDFNHNPNSSIVDLSETKVLNKKFCRILAWYDNEWGFSNRLVDVISTLSK